MSTREHEEAGVQKMYLELDLDLIVRDSYWHTRPQPSHLGLTILREADMFVRVLDQHSDNELSIRHRH